eukprot:4151905-Amphidinium_carterae.1
MQHEELAVISVAPLAASEYVPASEPEDRNARDSSKLVVQVPEGFVGGDTLRLDVGGGQQLAMKVETLAEFSISHGNMSTPVCMDQKPQYFFRGTCASTEGALPILSFKQKPHVRLRCQKGHSLGRNLFWRRMMLVIGSAH